MKETTIVISEESAKKSFCPYFTRQLIKKLKQLLNDGGLYARTCPNTDYSELTDIGRCVMTHLSRQVGLLSPEGVCVNTVNTEEQMVENLIKTAEEFLAAVAP